LAPNATGTKVGSDTNTCLVVWYVDPESMRNVSASNWSIEPEYLYIIQTRLHRHRRRAMVSKGFQECVLVELGDMQMHQRLTLEAL
jgi:hypothetical protein